MATARICDRCDEIVRGSIPLGGSIDLLPAMSTHPSQKIDLCMKCWDLLRVWLRQSEVYVVSHDD